MCREKSTLGERERDKKAPRTRPTYARPYILLWFLIDVSSLHL